MHLLSILMWFIVLLVSVKVIRENRYLFTADNAQINKFMLIPVSLFVTCSLYYLYLHIYYIPGRDTSYAVFLAPRFYGSMNDMPSAIFSQWKELSVIFPALMIIISCAFWSGLIKNISFKSFLVFIYFSALLSEFLFVFFTGHGIQHIAMQASSINNGIWYSITLLQSQFAGMHDLDKLRYIFQVLCANYSPYTIPGTTHPAGMFIITFAIHKMSYLLAMDLFHDIRFMQYFWGFIVSAVGTLIIPVTMLVARELYNEKSARLTGIMMIAVPSVCMHFCSVIDVVASFFIAAGILGMVSYLKNIGKSKNSKSLRSFVYGLAAGTSFTLAAQITFGHAIPIFALLAAFIYMSWGTGTRRLLVFLSGLIIPAMLYFVFEYYISNGKLFYIVRAFTITKIVETGLEGFRPYPVSQIANFIVMFIMGGILFLPVLFHTTISFFSQLIMHFKNRVTIINNKQRIKNFLTAATFIMFVMLASQKTVRLETERTWHWFFVPVWMLSSVFFNSIYETFRRLFNIEKDTLYPAYFFVCFQMVLTVVLAMCIQDYY